MRPTRILINYVWAVAYELTIQSIPYSHEVDDPLDIQLLYGKPTSHCISRFSCMGDFDLDHIFKHKWNNKAIARTVDTKKPE